MNDVILLYSKFSNKMNSCCISFDVVLYKNMLYADTNLFKNFINYLCDEKAYSVIKFTNRIDAELYFNNIIF